MSTYIAFGLMMAALLVAVLVAVTAAKDTASAATVKTPEALAVLAVARA